jgi:excisionase family DNA binding protein
MKSLLSTQEVAEKLNVSEPHIRHLLQKGAFEGAVKIGWVWRIPSDTVDRVMKEGVSYPDKVAT